MSSVSFVDSYFVRLFRLFSPHGITPQQIEEVFQQYCQEETTDITTQTNAQFLQVCLWCLSKIKTGEPDIETKRLFNQVIENLEMAAMKMNKAWQYHDFAQPRLQRIAHRQVADSLPIAL